MKPYSKHGPLSYSEKIFNYRLSRARRVIENTFGILVSKFRIFERPIALRPDSVDKVIKAACALHNWQRKTSAEYVQPSLIDAENIETHEYTPGNWRNVHSGGLTDGALQTGSSEKRMSHGRT